MISKTTEERFWEKVDRRSDVECWLWLAACNQISGYPAFYYRSRQGWARRYSYELHNGRFDEAMQVGDTCGNRKCVNPTHLFLGTIYECNMKPVSKSPANLQYRSHTCPNGHRRVDGDIWIVPSAKRRGKTWRCCRLCLAAKQKRTRTTRLAKDPEYDRRAWRKWSQAHPDRPAALAKKFLLSLTPEDRAHRQRGYRLKYEAKLRLLGVKRIGIVAVSPSQGEHETTSHQ